MSVKPDLDCREAAEHQRHQELFTERRRLVGFCRWMASRYRGVYPTKPGKSHKQLEIHSSRNSVVRLVQKE
jgi:hypothetical protein